MAPGAPRGDDGRRSWFATGPRGADAEGLATAVARIRDVAVRVRAGGRPVVVVGFSQGAALALEVADHGYVMENGRIVLEGGADQLRENSDIKEFYLGLNEVGARKSYRDVKHYKRRKRWL